MGMEQLIMKFAGNTVTMNKSKNQGPKQITDDALPYAWKSQTFP